MIATLPAPSRMIVPAGTQVVTTAPGEGSVEVDLDLADYDYTPFADPAAPEFEFVADIVCVHPDLTTTIDRGVACISSPGRTSREKE